MRLGINHPTDRPNFAIVGLGSAEFAFSYRTLVGFRVGWSDWTVIQNYWGRPSGIVVRRWRNGNRVQLEG